MKRAVWMFAALTVMCGAAFGAEYSTATLTSRAVSVLCLDSDRDGTSVTLTESLAGMIPGTLQQVTQTGATTDRTVSVGGLTVNGNTFTGRIGVNQASPTAELDIWDTDADGFNQIILNEPVSGSPQRIGDFYFKADDSNSSPTIFSAIRTYVEDRTDASEDGEWVLSVVRSGALSEFLSIGTDAVSGAGAIWNDEGLDADFRFEGDGDQNLLRLDAGNDRVGIGAASPSAKLHVDGTASLDGAVTINDSGTDADFRVESDAMTHALFVQGSDGAVAVGTNAPVDEFSVIGSGTNAGDISMLRNSINSSSSINFSGLNGGAVCYSQRILGNSTNGLIFYTDPSPTDTNNNLTARLQIEDGGEIYMPAAYSDDVSGKTITPLYIASDGQLGYDSSRAVLLNGVVNKIAIESVDESLLDDVITSLPIKQYERAATGAFEVGAIVEEWTPVVETLGLANVVAYYPTTGTVTLDDGTTEIRVIGMSDEPMAINWIKVTPLLLAELQRQRARLDALEARIEALEKQ